MRSFIIGLLLLLVVAVAAMYATGVIRVKKTKDEVNITVDKQELERQTEKAVESARENTNRLTRKAGEALQRTGQDLQREADEHDADREQPATSTSTP